MFDRLQRGDFLPVHKREGVADILGATGASDAMHVIFRTLRHVVIDDATYSGDVKAALRDVGGVHHFVFTNLESFERFDALALGAIGVQHGDGVSGVFQKMRDPIRILFCPAKNQDAVEVGALQQSDEQIEFLLGRNRINRVRDCFRRRTAHADLHHFRITQHPRSEALDLWWQRRRKQKRLSIPGNLFHYAAHIWQKSHVEHAIDLIEHEDVHIAKMERSLLEMIEQSSRRRDKHIDSALEVFALFPVTDTAVHNGHAQIGETPIIPKGGLDLRGQLAGWLQHETTKFSVMPERSQDRQSESGGFSHAGLCPGDAGFFPSNNVKDWQLDRSWFSETHRLGSAHDVRQKSKVIK